MHFRNTADGSTVSKEKLRERFGGQEFLDAALTEVITQCMNLENTSGTNIQKMAMLNKGVANSDQKPTFGGNTSVKDILLIMGVFPDYSGQHGDLPYKFGKGEQSVLGYLRETIIEFFTAQYTRMLLEKRFSNEPNSGIGIIHFDPHVYLSQPSLKCKCDRTLSINNLQGRGSFRDASSNWMGYFSECGLLKCLVHNVLRAHRTAEENGAKCFKFAKKTFVSFPICHQFHWSLLEATIEHNFFKQEYVVHVMHQNASSSFEKEAYIIIAHLLMCNKLISLHQIRLDSFLEYKGKSCHIEMKTNNFSYEFEKVDRSDSMKQPVYDATNCGVYTLASVLLDTPSRTVCSIEKCLKREQTLGIDGIRKILLADCLNSDLLTRSSPLSTDKFRKKTKCQIRNEKRAKKRKLKLLTQFPRSQEKRIRPSTA